MFAGDATSPCPASAASTCLSWLLPSTILETDVSKFLNVMAIFHQNSDILPIPRPARASHQRKSPRLRPCCRRSLLFAPISCWSITNDNVDLASHTTLATSVERWMQRQTCTPALGTKRIGRNRLFRTRTCSACDKPQNAL